MPWVPRIYAAIRRDFLPSFTTGQYCKKIRGKIYYFGTDKKQAHQRYPDTNVGGYDNTMWDIVFNTFGAIIAVIWITAKRNKSPHASEAL